MYAGVPSIAPACVRLEARTLLIDRVVRLDVAIPLDRMDLVHLAHTEGKVLQESYDRGVADLHCVLPRRLESRFTPYVAEPGGQPRVAQDAAASNLES